VLYNLYLVFILTKGTTRCCSSRKYNQYQDFKLAGAQLKKLRRAEVGAKKFGVFRVKKHDFTPKIHILGGGRAPGAPPLPPEYNGQKKRDKKTNNGRQNTTQKTKD
jgi:hypothetical protein